MDIDFELYRRNITTTGEKPIRLSLIDVAPERPAHTIVLLHGYGGNARQWKYQLRALSVSNRCIALDLRGHGRSEKPSTNYDMDEFIADLEDVLTLLKVQEPFVIMAHSFGGAIAVTFAHRSPERVARLILTATAARYELPWYTRRLLGLPLPVLNAIRPFVKRQISAPPVVLKKFALTMGRYNGRGMLRSLEMPTLIIRADRDVVFPTAHYEEVAQLVPHAEEINVGVSKHMVILERRDAVERAVDRFLGLGHASWRSGDDQGAQRDILLKERPWLKMYEESVPLTISIPNRPLQSLLTSAATRFANRPATIFMKAKLSYRQLDQHSNRLSHSLINSGLKPGDRVMLMMPNCPQWIIAFYAILKAGGIVVGTAPTSANEEISREVIDSGATILITLKRYAAAARFASDQSPNLRQIIYTHLGEYAGIAARMRLTEPDIKPLGSKESTWANLMHSQPTHTPDVHTEPASTALIQYTGGTTDQPKGVALSHRALVANALQTRHWLPDIRPGHEKMLCVVPFAHVYGMTGCMNTSISMGAAMIILPRFDVTEVLQAIKRHKPSLFPGVPTMYVAINNAPNVRRYGIEHIRACISGAAPLPVEVQEQFEKLTKGRLVEGYGLTEAGPITHANPLRGMRKTGSIGVPLPNTEAKVVHLQTGEDVETGQIGELIIRGPQVMDAYWQSPQSTAQALRNGWLYTGDVARMDSDGTFQIISRKRDMWYAGSADGSETRPAFPRDVEEVIYEIPEVKEVAVVAIGSKPVAFITARKSITPGTITGYCERRLPPELVPVLVVFVEDMPRSFVGKIIRRRLLAHVPPPALSALDITSDRIDDMLSLG